MSQNDPNQPRQPQWGAQQPAQPPQWGQQPNQPQWGQPGYQAPPKPPKKHTARNVVIGFGGVLVVLIVIGAAIGGGGGDKKSDTAKDAPAPVASKSGAKAPAKKADAKPAAKPKAKPAEKKKVSDVATFKVWGNAPAGALGPIDITYGSDTENIQGHGVPMTKTLKVSKDAMYYNVTAQLQGSGDIHCSVTIGGKTKTAHAQGGYNICSAQLSGGLFGGWS
ncbi:hypothetical protein [Streptomyces sp. NBC_01180]|uniref:hypothetical protein n=1 Tax=Streptomyces sp. NBC_01180 TaxID=2903763 RepID=UPI00386D1898|nr:hypothetical protein OG708_14680 [Streptomyces sp. NBC_01180]